MTTTPKFAPAKAGGVVATDRRIQSATQAVYQYFSKEGGVINEMDEYMRLSIDGMYLVDDIACAAITAFLQEDVPSQEILDAMMGGICLPALNLHLVEAMQKLYAAGYMVIRAQKGARQEMENEPRR